MGYICEGYDPQRSQNYYVDKDHYHFPKMDIDEEAQYQELGCDGNKEYSRFQLIGGHFVEGLLCMGSMLLFEYGIEHYLDDYEKTILCIKCGRDIENEYPDILVWRYWEYCPFCGTELVLGYVKIRDEGDAGIF